MGYGLAVVLSVAALAQPASAPGAQSRPKVQEIRVQWQAYEAPPTALVTPGSQPGSNVFTILERRELEGSLPRQRRPELSADHIVVVPVDEEGRAVVTVDERGESVFSFVVPDPRIVRAEAPGPSGSLSGEVLHRANTEFLLALPEDPSVRGFRIFHPRWTGTTFVLDPLGTIRLE